MAQQSKPAVPSWLLGLTLSIILLSPTQITLQHMAFRVAGVRVGMLEAVVPGENGGGVICRDAHGVFAVDELKGEALWLGDTSFPITGNSQTEIRVEATAADIEAAADSKMRYMTGFQAKSGLVGLALRVPGINFTLADILLGLSFLGFIGLQIYRRDWSCWWLPPWPVLVLLAVCFFSLVTGIRPFDQSYNAEIDWKKGIKELIQIGEVFVVGLVVFRGVLRESRARRLAVNALLFGCGMVVLVGMWEYVAIFRESTLRGLKDVGELDSIFGFRFNPGRSNQAGSEASKNVLATYLVFMMPFLLAMVRTSWQKWSRALLIVLLAGAAVLILNPFLLICAMAGMLAVTLQWRSTAGSGLVLLGTLAVVSTACVLNKHHGRVLMDSAAMYRYEDSYGLLPMPVKGMGQETHQSWDPWQQKYVEMQTAVNAISFSPVLGHGLGHYQTRINAYYTEGILPGVWVQKSPVNFMERDAHGIYFVTAVECGLLGLLALVFLLVWMLNRTFTQRAESEDGTDKAIVIGISGALVSLLLAGFFSSFLVRGVQLIVIAGIAVVLGMAPQKTNVGDDLDADDQPSLSGSE